MKISVLIAAQRAGEFLPAALASVGAQLQTDWEVVVVEYGPRDNTQAVVREFAAGRENVRYEAIEESLGSAEARNRLLELATGDAVAFLEPQDAWMPKHLSNAIQHLEAGADVVVSDARVFDPKTDRLLSEVVVPPQVGSATIRTVFARDVIPTASCVVVRRAIATSVGGFDVHFRSGEVRDFWLRCAVNGARFVVTHRPTCRSSRISGGGTGRALLNAESAALFYEKHRDLPSVPAALRRRLLAGSLVAQGRLLRTIDPNRAAKCFWRAWSLQPVHVQTLGQFALTGWQVAGTPEKHDSE